MTITADDMHFDGAVLHESTTERLHVVICVGASTAKPTAIKLVSYREGG